MPLEIVRAEQMKLKEEIKKGKHENAELKKLNQEQAKRAQDEKDKIVAENKNLEDKLADLQVELEQYKRRHQTNQQYLRSNQEIILGQEQKNSELQARIDALTKTAQITATEADDETSSTKSNIAEKMFNSCYRQRSLDKY